jgi:uncharacterized membrane protein
VIEDPAVLLAYLAAVTALVFQAARQPALKRLFDLVPALVFAYFVPMLSTTAGLLPVASPLYGALSTWLLPACLVLLLLSSEIRSVARLGGTALLAMTVAIFGMSAGVILAFSSLRSLLPADAWKAGGALAATWIGGSANLLAVAHSLEIEPGPIVIVDTVVGYSWMGLLLFLAGKQAAIDRRTGADRGMVEAVSARINALRETGSRPLQVTDATLLVAVALAATVAARALAGALPEVGAVLNARSWPIVLVTTFGLLLSLTPLARLEQAGASALGYAGFYLLIASVGAQGDLRALADQPALALAGVLAIAFHAALLLGAVRLLRAPFFFFGAASQACTGGLSSAPLVADAYQRGAAPVGLLLAVLGNVAGTYVGLLVAQVLKGS